MIQFFLTLNSKGISLSVGRRLVVSHTVLLQPADALGDPPGTPFFSFD